MAKPSLSESLPRESRAMFEPAGHFSDCAEVSTARRWGSVSANFKQAPGLDLGAMLNSPMPNSDHPPRPVPVEARDRTADARQCSPSAARNRGPILKVLTRVLPKKGIVLEIASGTGEHTVYFAKALPLPQQISSPGDRAGRFCSQNRK